MNGSAKERDYFSKAFRNMEGDNKEKAKKWIRCREAVERYGVSRPTVMRWAEDSGALFRIDNTILIDCEALDNYVESFRLPGGVY